VTAALASRLFSHLRSPWDDVLSGLDRCLASGARAFVPIAAGLALGWWLYVPVHELLHAAGCVVAGGSVSRLEIEALYGGALLARIFPFVVSGSDYAGRLSGFDTHGSDLVYLVTDLAPFLVCSLPAVFFLRRAGRRARPFCFAALLPWALAPFLSLTGDAYEIGSLAVRQLPPWNAPPVREVLVADDLAREWQTLRRLGNAAPWSGFALGCLVGVLWAFSTYACGSALAAQLGEPPERAGPQPRREIE